MLFKKVNFFLSQFFENAACIYARIYRNSIKKLLYYVIR